MTINSSDSSGETPETDRRSIRDKIDEIDDWLRKLLADRFKLTDSIAPVKFDQGLPVVDVDRQRAKHDEWITRGMELGMSSDFMSILYDRLHDEACLREQRIIDGLATAAGLPVPYNPQA